MKSQGLPLGMRIVNPPPMDRHRQAERIRDHEAGVEQEVDPVSQHPTINDLPGDPDECQDEEPECRCRGVLVPILPLLVGLQSEGGDQYRACPNR